MSRVLQIIIILVILVTVYILFYHKEGFAGGDDAAKRERAQLIYTNIKDYKQVPPFAAFKRLIPEADAAEYYDVALLKERNTFNIANIEQMLGVSSN